MGLALRSAALLEVGAALLVLCWPPSTTANYYFKAWRVLHLHTAQPAGGLPTSCLGSHTDAHYAQPAGEPFPEDSTKLQVCCPAGTQGYFDGEGQPTCCPDGERSSVAGTTCLACQACQCAANPQGASNQLSHTHRHPPAAPHPTCPCRALRCCQPEVLPRGRRWAAAAVLHRVLSALGWCVSRLLAKYFSLHSQLLSMSSCAPTAAFCVQGQKKVCCSQTLDGGTCKIVAGWGGLCCPTGEAIAATGGCDIQPVQQWSLQPLNLVLPLQLHCVSCAPPCPPCCRTVQSCIQLLCMLCWRLTLPVSGGLRLQQVLRPTRQ